MTPDELLKRGPLPVKDVDTFLSNLHPRGRIFTVTFIKSNGSVRKMTCRRDVKKYVKGGKNLIADHTNLVGVFDMHIKEYRCFDKTCVLELVSGREHAG